MPEQNYPLRAWVDGYPPVTAFDMLQINTGIDDLDYRLAQVEDALDALPKGRIGTRVITTDGPLGIAGTEIVTDTITVLSPAGRRLRVTYDATHVGSAASYWEMRMRFANGATVTTASTEIYFKSWAIDSAMAGNWDQRVFLGELVTTASGTLTIGMTQRRATTTATLDVRGSQRRIYVDDVGK